MSLQVWLPLNGDLKNYGLSGFSFFGIPASYSDGKIGKAATFNGAVANVIYNNTIECNYTNNFSFSLWMYPIYTGSTAQYAFTVGRADTGGYGYGVEIANATQINVRFGNVITTIDCPSNEWNHITMVVKNSSILVYKNGILVSTKAVGSLPTYSDGNGIGLGCFHYASGNIYPYYGKLNDFRLYDHALSLKEVKEIAKGLVLHYPLNKPMPNLIIGSDKYLLNKPYTHTSSAKDGINFMGSDLWMPCTPGKTYTFLFNTDGIWAPTHDTSGNGGGKIHFYLYLMEDSTNPGDFARPVDLTNNYKVNDNITGLGIWTYKIPTDKAYTKIMFRVDIHSNGSTSYTCHYWNFKAEEGNKATPWIPNESDPLYAAAGYASGIVYDCSGYLNNGIEVGTITGSSDTPRYRSSSKFSNSSYITYLLPPTMYYVTYSFWLKFSSFTAYGAINMLTSTPYGGDGPWFSCNTEGAQLWAYFGGNSPYYTKAGSGDLLTNTWYHCVYVWNNGVAQWYLNGEKLGNAVTYTDKKYISNSTTATIGDSYTGSSWNGTPFTGLLSDFRVYATALSADDIKALYNDAGYVDKNGNFHAYEFVEI